MESITRRVTISSSRAEVKIVCMGCIHHGAAGCDEKLADFWYEKILNSKDTYCILGGDLVDSIYEKDRRYSDEEVARWCFQRKWGGTLIDRQYHYALSKWEPLAKKGKILWIHAGNHEWKLKSLASRDLTLDWARALKVPYAGLSALSHLIMETPKGTGSEGGRGMRVSFFTTHGGGGAQSDGAVINRVAGMLNQYDVDIALMWHLHRKMHVASRVMGLAKGGGSFVHRDRIAAVCGTFLDGHLEGVSGYGELKGYKPVVLGPMVVHIKLSHQNNGTRIWVSDAIMDEKERG